MTRTAAGGPAAGGHTLVARLDNDGDVLLAGPAIRAVAAGSRRVTLLCGPRGRRAGGILPGVDAVEVFRAPWIDPEPDPVDPAAIDALRGRIAGLAPDRAVVLTSFHQSPLPLALVLRTAGVPWVGAVSDDYPGSLLDLRHRVPDDLHEAERGLSLAAASGFPLPDGDDGRLRVLRDARERPRGLPARYVVLHPGASVTARRWPAHRFAALAARLAAAGTAVVVTGGPEETGLTAAVAGPAGVDLGGRTSLQGLAEVLAGADAVVVGNTGPAHLAAAVGCPVVWSFAPTVPAVRWHPWRTPFTECSVPVPCAGCRARTCPVEGHPCMAGMRPRDVLRALAAYTGGGETCRTLSTVSSSNSPGP
ncbi:MAG: glycosyltransferase family 9 protein [Thermoleophilia bacterium]